MALKLKPKLNRKTLSQKSSFKLTYIQRFCKLAYIDYDFHAMDLVSIINRQMLERGGFESRAAFERTTSKYSTVFIGRKIDFTLCSEGAV